MRGRSYMAKASLVRPEDCVDFDLVPLRDTEVKMAPAPAAVSHLVPQLAVVLYVQVQLNSTLQPPAPTLSAAAFRHWKGLRRPEGHRCMCTTT